MDTVKAMGQALENGCADPEDWGTYWENRRFNGAEIKAILTRAVSAHMHHDSELGLATAMVCFSAGYELGKLSSDPRFWLETPFRCPVDNCSFRSGIAEYRGFPIVCPSHGNPLVPIQEGWE